MNRTCRGFIAHLVNCRSRHRSFVSRVDFGSVGTPKMSKVHEAAPAQVQYSSRRSRSEILSSQATLCFCILLPSFRKSCTSKVMGSWVTFCVLDSSTPHSFKLHSWIVLSIIKISVLHTCCTRSVWGLSWRCLVTLVSRFLFQTSIYNTKQCFARPYTQYVKDNIIATILNIYDRSKHVVLKAQSFNLWFH